MPKYKCTNISYDLSGVEDVDMPAAEIIIEVPSEDADDGTINDLLCDRISDLTGFLVESFSYDELQEPVSPPTPWYKLPDADFKDQVFLNAHNMFLLGANHLPMVDAMSDNPDTRRVLDLFGYAARVVGGCYSRIGSLGLDMFAYDIQCEYIGQSFTHEMSIAFSVSGHAVFEYVDGQNPAVNTILYKLLQHHGDGDVPSAVVDLFKA